MPEGVSVQEVMAREFLGISKSDTVGEVAQIMLAEDRAAALVLRGNRPVGAVTAEDLLASYLADNATTTIDEVMAEPPDPVQADDKLSTALSELATQEVRQLPVVDHGEEVVGVVTAADVIAGSASLVATRIPTNRQGGGVDDTATPPSQGVCESCGAMSADLNEHNGQLLCPNCQTVQ